MTIEQLAEEATDGESFSLEGDVVVEIPENTNNFVHVMGASYNAETKQLVLRVARQEQET